MTKETKTEKTKLSFIEKLDRKIHEEWDDEKCLEAFGLFLNRVEVSNQFVENEDGLLTHQVLALISGDKVLVSDPMEFEWPLQRLPMPEALKDRLN